MAEPVAQEIYDRLDDILHNWAQWMRTGGLSCLDTPGKASGIGYSHSQSFDDLLTTAQRNEAVIVDGSMRDLKRLERAVIHWAYLDAAWTEIASPHVVLVVAREALRISMRRRGWGELLTT